MRWRAKGREQRCTLCVRYADSEKRRGVCVVCGGIGRSGRGALQRRGRSAGKRVGEKRNAEQAEPVRKGNHGSDEGDPKPPSVSEKKEGRGGRGSKNASRWTGTSRKSFAGLDVECAEKEAWGCALQIRLYYNLIDIRCEVYAISSVLPCLPLRRLASSLPELATSDFLNSTAHRKMLAIV
jgi:hypothetical protein